MQAYPRVTEASPKGGGGRQGETTLPDWPPGLRMKAQEAIELEKWQMVRRVILDMEAL